MSSWTLDTPIALIIFNRPDTTARVLSRIAEVKPRTLLVIADGPRQGRLDDEDRCMAARNLLKDIDWPCEILTHFADMNLGCKWRVSSGLDWVFQNVEEAIVLEDDCVPDTSFFPYCEQLLERYRSDNRIMTISGQNLQFGRQRGQYSYYFSRYCHIWGWATWRRAWHHYDVNMELWPRFRTEGWLQLLLDRNADARRWSESFERMYRNQVDTWDIQWLFACMIQRGLCVVPNVNMISNIGFGPSATHTTNAGGFLDSLGTQPVKFPLEHPPFVVRHRAADDFLENAVYHQSPVYKVRRMFAKLARGLGDMRKSLYSYEVGL